MQLSIVNKALTLAKGKYLSEDEKKQYNLIITETYSTPVTITAKDLDSAKTVAKGLYDLGLIEKSPENKCVEVEGVPSTTLMKKIQNDYSKEFSRF